MNLDMTWEELARAAGGRLVNGNPGDPVVSISTDTRDLSSAQAFWVLRGARFDAHDFLSEELARACDGWVVSRPGLKPKPRHLVEVENSLKALQALALHHRRRFDIPIVGITGSNGKTTTKEMLACICRRVGPTCANAGNLNNQVGLPLSLLELGPSHRYGLFEMGASRPGDIAELGRIAQPVLAVLTNIGPAHIEFFKTLDQTFKTKSELIDCLPEEGGKAVINVDDPWLSSLEARLGDRAVTYGSDPRARIRFLGYEDMIIDRHKIRVSLKTFGNLSRYNAAAAAAAAWALGISPETIRQGLEDYEPSQMRLERRRHASGAELVLDAYNANPASMIAAIEGFCAEFSGLDKVLVLGDMKELGADSERYHRELGQMIASLPIEAAYLAGAEMRAAYEAIKAAKPSLKAFYGATPDSWKENLAAELAPGRALFFKASRAMRFEQILDNLPCSTI